MQHTNISNVTLETFTVMNGLLGYDMKYWCGRICMLWRVMLLHLQCSMVLWNNCILPHHYLES